MNNNFIASALLTIQEHLFGRRDAPPPAAQIAKWGIGTGILRRDDGSWWIKLSPGGVLAKIYPQGSDVYAPAVPADWDLPLPTTFAEALDQLAARVRVLETTPGTSGPLIETFNCGALVSVGDAVYVSVGVKTVDRAIATSAATMPTIGFVIAKPTPVTCRVQLNGTLILPAGHPALPLVPLRTYYVDLLVPGNIIPVVPPPPWPPQPPWASGNVVQEIGVAVGPGELLVQIDRDYTQL